MDLSAALQEETIDATYETLPEVLSSRPVLSLEAVRPKFSEYLIRVEKMKRDAENVEVENDESLKYAVALGGEAKKIVKGLDAKRKDVTAEASDFVKSVNGFVKMFTDSLDTVEKTLKKKIGDYQYKVELERREQERKAREATEALQRKLREEAEEANRKAREEAARIAEEAARARAASQAEIDAARKKAEEEAKRNEIEAPTVMAPVIPEVQKVTHTETGTSSYQVKSWKAEIINEAEVPREYCSPDMRKINDAVKMGAREVKGVRIYEETSTRFRT
jgi:uncharacterized membrane protein YqiK